MRPNREPDLIYPAEENFPEIRFWVKEGIIEAISNENSSSYFPSEIKDLGEERIIRIIEGAINNNMFQSRRALAANFTIEYGLLGNNDE